jgi:hypothetical protein
MQCRHPSASISIHQHPSASVTTNSGVPSTLPMPLRHRCNWEWSIELTRALRNFGPLALHATQGTRSGALPWARRLWPSLGASDALQRTGIIGQCALVALPSWQLQTAKHQHPEDDRDGPSNLNSRGLGASYESTIDRLTAKAQQLDRSQNAWTTCVSHTSNIVYAPGDLGQDVGHVRKHPCTCAPWPPKRAKTATLATSQLDLVAGSDQGTPLRLTCKCSCHGVGLRLRRRCRGDADRAT